MVKWIILIVIIILIVVLFGIQSRAPERISAVEINGVEVEVEVADTPGSRAQGLSGRENLEENQGMLFVFESAGFHSFWMKDMNFPIDIIWIDENLEIIGVEKEVAPESFPKTFAPELPVRYVLEVNSGWAERNNIKIGDKIIWVR